MYENMDIHRGKISIYTHYNLFVFILHVTVFTLV